MTDPTEYLWTAPTIATARLRAATLARMTGRAALIIAGPACFFVMADRADWSDGLSPRASVAERMSLSDADAVLVAHAAAVAQALADTLADTSAMTESENQPLEPTEGV